MVTQEFPNELTRQPLVREADGLIKAQGGPALPTSVH
jgi:hypothetical protein